MKKEKKKLLEAIFVLLIAFSMVSSIAGFLVNRNHSTSYSYDGRYYYVSSKGKTIKLFTNPSILASNSTMNAFSMLHLGNNFYYSFDPSMSNEFLVFLDPSRYILAQNLEELGINIVFGVTKNSSYALPIINCNSSIPTIIVTATTMNASPYPKIIASNNCYKVILSNPQQAVLLNDYIAFSYLEK